MANLVVGGQLASIIRIHLDNGLSLTQITKRLHADHGIEVSVVTLSKWTNELRAAEPTEQAS